MRASFLLAATIVLASAANAALRLTPEVPVADPHVAPAEGTPIPTEVLSDGERFVVFWGGPAGLNATFVTADGKPAGTRVVLPSSSSVWNLSACWTGITYVLAWQVEQDSSIYATALNRDGEMIATPRAVVTNAVSGPHNLASNGRRVFLAYSAYSGPSHTPKGALLDANANVIASKIDLPIGDISSNRTGEAVPQVASDGKDFALVWRTGELVPITSPGVLTTPPPLGQLFHDFHLLRVTESGEAVGPIIDLGRTEQSGSFGVAFGRGVYAVVTTESHLLKPGYTQARLVRFVVDPISGAVTRLPLMEAGGGQTSVFWNGAQFVAYWNYSDATTFRLATLAFSGTEMTSTSPVLAYTAMHGGSYPVMASNGRNTFGAWSEYTTGYCCVQSAIEGALFNASATSILTRPALISSGWSRQFSPALATSGRDSLVLWLDEDGSSAENGRLLAARIGSNGVVLDRTPIEIAQSARRFVPPVVTFTGSTYLVAWNEGAQNTAGSVIVRTIAPDGSLGERTSIGPGYGLSIASSATTTLLSYTNQKIVGVRFKPSGERIDTTPLIIGDGYSPKVASNGSDFFVAWNVGSNYWQFPSPDYVDVMGARVTASGSVDATPIGIATGPADQVLQAVESDGRDYLVVYTLSDLIHPYLSLAAKRVLREGQLDGATSTDAGTIVDSAGSVSNVAMTHDETGYWIGWIRGAYSDGAVMLVHTDARGNGGTPLPVVDDSGHETPNVIALAHAPGGMLQIAYARRISDGPFAGTSRVFFRFAGEAIGKSRAARH